MKKLIALATTVAALAIAAPANAALLQFTLSGFDTPANNNAREFASFQLDSNPIVAAGDSDPGMGFILRNVPGTYQYGSSVTMNPQDVSFYTPRRGGGLCVGDPSCVLAVDGVQLYTGTETNPMFITGEFVVTDTFSGAPLSLTITPVVTAPVPEPATWAFLIGGFGVMGGTLRARRTSVRFANA